LVSARSSTLSITKSKKFRPCLVLKANPMANFTSICLMATFGGADFDDLSEITRRSYYTRPPPWPRDPQWMICWGINITTAPSAWSGAVPYSVDAATVEELKTFITKRRKNLFKAASADRNLKKRLHADLMVRRDSSVSFD
ncbi:hypothetical protein CPB85DRAFT_1341452, partial [Mucidula mucida]